MNMRLQHDHAVGYRIDCKVCQDEIRKLADAFTDLHDAFQVWWASNSVAAGERFAARLRSAEELGLTAWDVRREAAEERHRLAIEAYYEAGRDD